MANMKTLAKDTAIYGLSSIVGRFLNYLLVPLYTYTLKSCADYGIVSDLYSQTALLLAILTFGMETTFFRFANKEEHPETVFSTVLIMVGSVAALFLLCVLGGLPLVAGALGYGEHPWYVGMMAIVVAMDAVQAILFGYLRFKRKAVKFMTFKMTFIILNCELNALAYGVLPKYMESWNVTVFWTFLINLISTSVVMLCFYKELWHCKWKFDKEYCRAMLRYTWPLLILSIAGILNQVAGQLMLPRVLDQEEGRTALGIYNACVKVAMIMALLTQTFRYAYEPFVFAQNKEKDKGDTYALGMKYFIIFTLLAFLGVMGYLPILQNFVGPQYRTGLAVIPIVMAAEIMMGIYFNLSFWYKLIDKTIYGAWFSLAGCAVLLAINWLFIPRYGYMACAWAGFAGYGVAMVLSYVVGQIKNPIRYPLKSIGAYVLITIFFFILMQLVPAEWPVWLRLALNTLIILAFVAHIIYHDLPLKELPFVGKYFRK